MSDKVKSKYYPSGYKPDGRPVTNPDEDFKLNPSHPKWYYENYSNSKFRAQKVKENKNGSQK